MKRRCRIDREQFADGHVPRTQHADLPGQRPADQRAAPVRSQLVAAVIIGQTFPEPHRHRANRIRDEQVRVLVVDDGGGLVESLEAENDVVGVGPAHEQPVDCGRPAVLHRHIRFHRPPVAEDEHDDWQRQRTIGVGNQTADDRAELLELCGDVAQGLGRLVADDAHRPARDHRPARLCRRKAGERSDEDDDHGQLARHGGIVTPKRQTGFRVWGFSTPHPEPAP